MNPINDCPLSVSVEDILSVLEWCDTPSLIMGKDKKLIACNASLEEIIKNEEIRILIQRITAGDFSLLNGMKVGELLCVKSNIKPSVCCEVARFDCFYFLSVKEGADLKPQSKTRDGVVIPSRYCSVDDDITLNTSVETRRGREGVTEDKSSFTMRYGTFDRISDEEGDDLLFDPGEAAAFVCNMAKNDVKQYKAELFPHIMLSDRLCDLNQEQYCLALTAMLIIAESHTDNGVVKIEGGKIGDKYKLSVIFGWSEGYKRLRQSENASFKDWVSFFGNDAVALSDYENDPRWKFELEEYRGGMISISLSVPLVAQKSFSFLRTYIKKETYKSVFNRFVRSGE